MTDSTQHMALMRLFGDLACDPVVCPRFEFNEMCPFLFCAGSGEVKSIMLELQPLTGSLSSALALLTKLELFSLFGSSALVGSIPALTDLSHLRMFDVTGSRVSGTLPPMPSSLTHLSVEATAISGTLPPSYESLSRLTYLSGARSALSGPFPRLLDFVGTCRFGDTCVTACPAFCNCTTSRGCSSSPLPTPSVSPRTTTRLATTTMMRTTTTMVMGTTTMATTTTTATTTTGLLPTSSESDSSDAPASAAPNPTPNIPVIAGAAGGALACVLIAIVLVVIACRRRRRVVEHETGPPIPMNTYAEPHDVRMGSAQYHDVDAVRAPKF